MDQEITPFNCSRRSIKCCLFRNR
ncbi:Bgt-50978 [Blumeria graminis f. sp. tritici]|uniref:Bgt-50978 n=1 Tax=Blumeria graminis f. sp. tritici TaxID=62690 RepID=A0A9X9L9Q7_BLUGR|nr:Bgt-50978 [Blumeria graminis f. sp. tritici]